VTAQAVVDPSLEHGFSHEAFFYSDPAEFLEASVSFVREGLAADEAVLVAVPGQRAQWLRSFFGAEPAVQVLDMADVGANPARIIPEWQDFLDAHEGRGVRGIGEPVWAGRSAAELAECVLHESLLNVAFESGPSWRLLCPYDAVGLPGSVLDQARATHPVVADAAGQSGSATYHRVPPQRALRGDPLPPPAQTPVELPFTGGDLSSVRRLVRRHGAEAGVTDARLDDVELAVDEVASNSLLHGGGLGVLRVWAEDESLVCEVSDEGVIADPLVGRRRPVLDRTGGRGLWIANQLCDLVQVRSGAAGTTVRLHVRLS
jgi:anti-sigma regulatory factor (Ser/Thr protein kinase)